MLLVGLLTACGSSGSDLVDPPAPPNDTPSTPSTPGTSNPPPGTPASVVLAPADTLLVVGESVAVRATVHDSAGAVITGPTVQWRSTDSAVADIDGRGGVAGVLHARTVGTTQLIATSGGRADTATVRVKLSLGNVHITPPAPLALGDSVHLAASVVDTAGREVPGAAVTWSSSDSTVVMLSADGWAHGLTAGTARVRAASGSRYAADSVDLTVVSSGGRVDLGTLGGSSSVALDINQAEIVVGKSELADGRTHAFRWTAATGMRDLGAIADSSMATAVNSQGYAAGLSWTAAGEPHVVLWTPGGVLQDLGAPQVAGAAPYTLGVNGLNGANTIVGSACDATFDRCVGWRWTQGGGFATLTPPANVQWMEARGINEAGDIVGAFRVLGDDEHQDVFLLLADGTFRDVGRGTLRTWAAASDVNDSRQIVGNEYQDDAYPEFWSDGTGFVKIWSDLEKTGIDYRGFANGVNSHGEVVGTSFTGPFYWSQTLGVVPIDTDGAGDATAMAINDAGTAVGGASGHAALWRGASRGPTSSIASARLAISRLSRGRIGGRPAIDWQAVRRCVRTRSALGRIGLAGCMGY